MKEKKNRCVKSANKKCPKGFKAQKGKCIKFKTICSQFRCPKVKCSKGYISKQFKHTCCPRCVPCKCSRYFDPVCSTSGVTFRNECEAKCNKSIIKHKGACNKPCDGRCPTFIKPVCGTDHKTYRNRCVLRSNLIKFKYNGKCGRKKKYVKDPKDSIKVTIKKQIQKQTKKYQKFLEKKQKSVCEKTLVILKKSVLRLTNILMKVTKKNKNEDIVKFRKLLSKKSKDLVKIMKDCTLYNKITKENSNIITDLQTEVHGFKDKWVFRIKKLKDNERLIRNKRMKHFSNKLKNCVQKSANIRIKWNKFFLIRKRAQTERVNKVRSIRVKKFLKKQYKR